MNAKKVSLILAVLVLTLGMMACTFMIPALLVVGAVGGSGGSQSLPGDLQITTLPEQATPGPADSNSPGGDILSPTPSMDGIETPFPDPSAMPSAIPDDQTNEDVSGDPIAGDHPQTGPAETPVMEQETDVVTLAHQILGDIDLYWRQVLENEHLLEDYRSPQLEISQHVQISPCHDHTNPSSGPYYCPFDETIYIDLDTLERNPEIELQDMALAFTLAHEFGHHIQRLQGILGHVAYKSFYTELQADCLAGAWAGSVYTRGMLEEGDYEEAIALIGTIGDPEDVLEENRHGTFQQRIHWFDHGFDNGEKSCEEVLIVQNEDQEEYDQLSEYFLTISENPYQCRQTTAIENASLSIECNFLESEQIIVYYDNWSTAPAMKDYFNNMKKVNPEAVEMNWYNANDAKKTVKGQLLQYLDTDGNAWLIWTVEGEHLTGTAILSGDDQERLFEWWASTGSLHPAD